MSSFYYNYQDPCFCPEWIRAGHDPLHVYVLDSTTFGKIKLLIRVLLNTAKDDKGPQSDVLNTAKYDKGPYNSNPNLKSFVVLRYGVIPSPLMFFAVFSTSV